jgi:type IV pilus assembly protein PilF
MGAAASKSEAARLNMDLGIGYLRQGEYESALVKMQKSLQEEPNNPTAHRALGLTYERLGADDKAETEYRIAVKQAPQDADALNQLAVFLCMKGEQTEAMGLFDRAINAPLYQARYLLYTNAGKCIKTSDLARAEDYLRRALALKADFPDALFQMADVAFQRGNFLQARAFIERYQAESQDSPAVLWLGYRIEMGMENRSGAKVFADSLVRNFPESVETRMLLEERRNAG